MSSPSPKNLDATIASLSRASAHLAALEVLANFGLATTKQVARFRFGKPTVTQEKRLANVMASLRRQELVLTRPTKDEAEENPRLKFFIPVHGLTEAGVAAARN